MIYEANNNNETSVAVYIDAMKAFDTVKHSILLREKNRDKRKTTWLVEKNTYHIENSVQLQITLHLTMTI